MKKIHRRILLCPWSEDDLTKTQTLNISKDGSLQLPKKKKLETFSGKEKNHKQSQKTHKLEKKFETHYHKSLLPNA